MAVEIQVRPAPGAIEELGLTVSMLGRVHREFEDGENTDPHEFYGALSLLVDHANAVLEWAAHARSEAARQGITA